MLEIRFHGRGGQGAVVAARILASAFAKEGKYALVIPDFKSERRSAPVAVSVRVDAEKILLRSKVYSPDIVIVLDGSLLNITEVQALAGLKEKGLVILNCADFSKHYDLAGFKVGFCDADIVARKYRLGPASLPAVGTAILGAFTKASGLLNLESVLEAAAESDELPKKKENILAIKETHDATSVFECQPAERKNTQSEPAGTNGKQLPLSVMSLGDNRGNKTGTWRKIKPEYSSPEDTISTCMVACPIHQDIREWLLALKSRNFMKAAEIILRHNPLASSVSRVCPVFCEKGCRHFRLGFDEPIAINAAEKFIGDWMLFADFQLYQSKIISEKKVAVVGSGPAGLSCAYSLRQKGYKVTVFERENTLGGLLRHGIPEDRLPKSIVGMEITHIAVSGVEFKTGVELNETNFEGMRKEYQAVFLAPGFSEGKKLDIPGADLDGVYTAIDFLKKANVDKIKDIAGKNVIVIGAGNTAMDSARTAKKLGTNRVIVAYRRKRENMRAFGNEIEETEKSGVHFSFEMVPLKIVKNTERGLLAEFQNNDLRVILGCDFVIMAVGQKMSAFFEKLLEEKSVEQMEKEGIFIGGDLLTGPKTVAHAIGSGNEAAKKISAFLEGRKYRRKIRRLIKKKNINLDYFQPMPRTAQIQEEAKRCFTCGFCDRCGNCWIFCSDMAISENKNGLKIDYDFCKGCQVCLNECPRSVISTSTQLSASTPTELSASTPTELSAREAKDA